MDDSDCRIAEQEGELDEQEWKRRYHERVSDWSEPGAVDVNREGRPLGQPMTPDRVE